ncbi:MAG: DUF4249 domain-containing protein [Bacteroidetes bacterium]|nr:DUF4249 domain-containing protein [Bacteroidota bacterium]
MRFRFSLYKILIVAISSVFAFGCKEVYTPPQSNTNPNYLVVDGVLTSGDSTKIKLSRTRNLNDSVLNSPEGGATVVVIGEGSDSYPLSEEEIGTYSIGLLSLNAGEKYKLDITTSDGKHYESDQIITKQTPPIDSLNWTINDNGVQVFVNTHDQSNGTLYYRWQYEETWEYHAAFDSYYTYTGGMLVPRNPNDHVYTCWHDRSSTELVLASSAGLSADVIYRNPVVFIPKGSEKISVEYSVLVKQYALTKEAYEYWESLKKSTELTGGLFDPLPAQLIGNIHCTTNPDEKALGYIAASSITKQRIFIKYLEVEPWPPPPQDCPEVIVPPDSVDYYFGKHLLSPVANHGLTDFSGSFASCVDCTLNGGTLVKPSFWP